MRLAPRGAHLDDPRYSLSFTVLDEADCQQGTAQCSVSMGGGGRGGCWDGEHSLGSHGGRSKHGMDCCRCGHPREAPRPVYRTAYGVYDGARA